MPAMITLLPLPSHAPGPVQQVSMLLSPDHQYNVAVQSTGVTTGHFAPSCLQAYGANPSCSDLEAQLTTSQQGQPNFLIHDPPFTCVKASDNGCDCTWYWQSTEADQGVWQTSGDILYFFSNQGTNQPIIETTFCAKPGQQLAVSGRNGSSMFSVEGLRTMTLVPM
jgi:hypothetical protein